MKEYDEDDWSIEAVEAAARRNRASWRQTCVEICAAKEHSSNVRALAGRLVKLIDETECMYHGGPFKKQEAFELIETLDELRNRL